MFIVEDMAEGVLPEETFPLIWPLSLLAVFFCGCTDGLLKKSRVTWFISYPLTYVFVLSLQLKLINIFINFYTRQSCLFGRWKTGPMLLSVASYSRVAGGADRCVQKKCWSIFGQLPGFALDRPENRGLGGRSPHDTREQTKSKIIFRLVFH